MNIYSLKNKGVAGNIWKSFIFSVTNKRSYMTFFSIFLLTLPNTTAQTVGFIVFMGQVFGFVFEIPSGYISDKIGHKNALVIAKISLLVGTLMLAIADSVIYFIISQLFMNIGFAMLSGTFSAFIQETLLLFKKEDQYSKIMGRIKSLGFAGSILFIILIPFVAEHYGYKMGFLLVALLDVIGIIVALSLKKTSKQKKVKEFDTQNKGNIFKQYMKIGWIRYVLFGQLLSALLFAATIGFKNPFQESIGFSISMLGILWAGSRLGASLLLLLSGWLKKHLTLKKVILMQGLFFALDLLGVALSNNKWVIAALFIIGTSVMWGFTSVQGHFLLEYIQDSKYKASFLSINTFIGRIITAAFSLLMGYFVLHKSYQFSFLVFGIAIMFVVVLGFFIMKDIKRTA